MINDPMARMALESMIHAFILYDREWRFAYINKRAEAMMGCKKEKVLGMVLWESFPETVDSNIGRHFLQVASTGESCDFEDFIPQSGLWLKLRVFRYESGHIGVFYDDITKTVAMENELRRVTREALAAAKAKSDFLAHMSHEI